jgi:hypothetical protein
VKKIVVTCVEWKTQTPVCLTQKRKNAKNAKTQKRCTLKVGKAFQNSVWLFVTVLYFGHVSAGLTFMFWIKCYKNILS